jgi:hypothetical protein
MHRPNELELATMRLATGVTLHYAEQVEPNGEAVILLHGTPIRWCGIWRRSWKRNVLPSSSSHQERAAR